MLVTGLGQAVLAIPIAFLTLAIVSIGLRLGAKRIRGRPWRLHDTLIIVGLTFSLLQVASVYYGVLQGGLGQHMSQLNDAEISKMYKGFTAHSLAWIFATNTAKLSVLAFYLDVFNIRVTFRRLTYAFMTFVIVYGVASMLCVFTICRPFKALWDRTIPGHCGNILNAMFATAVINTVEDLLVVIMPLPILWNLQVSKQKKMGMSAVIGFGLVICVINLCRLVFAISTSESDASYSQAYQVLFQNLEVQMGIINACVPTMKPLFSRKRPIAHTPPTYSGFSEGPSPLVTIGSGKLRKLSEDSDEQLLVSRDEKSIEVALQDRIDR